MRILVLGGTLFLSRAVAAEAVARGHDVTCAARGTSGSVPEGAHHVALDRGDPNWSALAGHWDAVVDVARTPSWVRDALAALADRTRHWIFVSSISVYADHETLRLIEPLHDDVVQDSAEAYGGSKVACEEAVLARAPTALVARPGLIIGPEDPSGRFTYWAERLSPEALAETDEVLCPPDGPVQVIDVRDLAAWLVTSAEQGRTGVIDTVGPVAPLSEQLSAIAPSARLTWVTEEFLVEHAVEQWSGPRSLPLWLTREHAGMLAHDVRDFLATGPTLRPVAESAADTAAWASGVAGVVRTGLTREEEAELLRDWHTVRP